MTDIEKYKEIAIRVQTIASYKTNVGAKCPLCGTYNSMIQGSSVWITSDGNRKRRHLCSACGLRYFSEEANSCEPDIYII